MIRSPASGLGGPFFYQVKSFPRNADDVYDHDDRSTLSVLEGEGPDVKWVVRGFGGLAAPGEGPLLWRDVHDGGDRVQSLLRCEVGWEIRVLAIKSRQAAAVNFVMLVGFLGGERMASPTSWIWWQSPMD